MAVKVTEGAKQGVLGHNAWDLSADKSRSRRLDELAAEWYILSLSI